MFDGKRHFNIYSVVFVDFDYNKYNIAFEYKAPDARLKSIFMTP